MATGHREKDVERFHQWSGSYEKSWLQRVFFEPVHRATLELAAGIVHEPASILDVGCGTGKLLRSTHTNWPEAQLIGVDPAEGMVEVARRLTPNATFSAGMAEALPVEDASVDLALSTTSFHHWRDQAAGIREIARALRPEGYFILVDFSFPALIVRMLRLKRVHSPAQMRALFNHAGLDVQTQQILAWSSWLATVGKK
jgi:ubiquinone/menaquinone biosynthesis C-methylase UbiE